MKAIETHFVGPSNTKGSRYVATDGDFRVIIGASDSVRYEDNHRRAAMELIERHWDGCWPRRLASGDWSLVEGATKRGYVFVVAQGKVA